ncbi:hypothetical protein TNCV_2278931 [Trichonephila clavipes]|uniref:Secreted protein n=1 Tax=Trichonephila clavipes TaxID=2585209 RepID=A0A8X6RDJ0_TRICX|nr:hypothetical protein TNCV_2278931 [Trichonephila clavipes]
MLPLALVLLRSMMFISPHLDQFEMRFCKEKSNNKDEVKPHQIVNLPGSRDYRVYSPGFVVTHIQVFWVLTSP